MNKKTGIALFIVIATLLAISGAVKSARSHEMAMEKLRIDAIESERIQKELTEDRIRDEAILEKEYQQLLFDGCLAKAEDVFWDYMELNGTGNRYDEGGVTAQTRFWNTANENKARAIDICLKRFN